MGALLTSVGAFKQSCTGSAFASDLLAACTADSLTPINYADGSQAFVEEIWSGNSAHKCELAFFGNRFGDPILGLRLEHQFNPTLSGADGEPQLLLPRQVDVQWYRADPLTIQTLCTASDNVNVVLQVYYTNVEGADQRLVHWELIQ